MDISTKQFKHCDLVSVKGRVDSATAPKLTASLEALLKEGRYKIVLDLSQVEYMSSAGFRAMLAALKTCKRYNRGDLYLASVPKLIHEALELTGMTSLFKIYDDVTTAVGNF
jgi:anti-sigma B factor antagonist